MILSSQKRNLSLSRILEKYLIEIVIVALYFESQEGKTVLMSLHRELSRTPRAMVYNWLNTHPS